MRNDDYSKPIYSTDEIHCAVSDFHQPHMNWWKRLKMKKQIRRLSMKKNTIEVNKWTYWLLVISFVLHLISDVLYWILK